MKIGATVTFFNAKMRERRKELGLTQKDLGRLCGVSQVTIGKIEILKLRAPTQKTKNLLLSIADALDCDIEYLFPPDYLDAMESRKLLWTWGTRFVFIRDIRLDELRPGEEPTGLLEESIEDKVFDEMGEEDLQSILCEKLEYLSEYERDVLKMRFGLNGVEVKTLDEIGAIYGVTKTRIRQVEEQALHRLRHPQISRVLRKLNFRGIGARNEN